MATADFLAEVYEPEARNIHGYSVQYKEVGIFGAGGTTNVGPAVPIDETEMYDLLKKGWERIRYLKKKIMVTHIHPTETKIEKFSKFVPGSDAVKKAVEKFKLKDLKLITVSALALSVLSILWIHVINFDELSRIQFIRRGLDLSFALVGGYLLLKEGVTLRKGGAFILLLTAAYLLSY